MACPREALAAGYRARARRYASESQLRRPSGVAPPTPLSPRPLELRHPRPYRPNPFFQSLRRRSRPVDYPLSIPTDHRPLDLTPDTQALTTSPETEQVTREIQTLPQLRQGRPLDSNNATPSTFSPSDSDGLMMSNSPASGMMSVPNGRPTAPPPSDPQARQNRLPRRFRRHTTLSGPRVWWHLSDLLGAGASGTSVSSGHSDDERHRPRTQVHEKTQTQQQAALPRPEDCENWPLGTDPPPQEQQAQEQTSPKSSALPSSQDREKCFLPAESPPQQQSAANQVPPTSAYGRDGDGNWRETTRLSRSRIPRSRRSLMGEMIKTAVVPLDSDIPESEREKRTASRVSSTSDADDERERPSQPVPRTPRCRRFSVYEGMAPQAATDLPRLLHRIERLSLRLGALGVHARI